MLISLYLVAGVSGVYRILPRKNGFIWLQRNLREVKVKMVVMMNKAAKITVVVDIKLTS